MPMFGLYGERIYMGIYSLVSFHERLLCSSFSVYLSESTHTSLIQRAISGSHTS